MNKINYYDIKRVITRSYKEFGKIERGTEEDYEVPLDNIEQAIYKIFLEIEITDYELQDAISAIIYDLKGYIENKNYDYKDILNDKVITTAKKLQTVFNPFVNKNIELKDEAYNNLKELFTLPIICLTRIYDSIDFWHKRYGCNGYFKMLEEMVVPVRIIGKTTYSLDEKYLKFNK